jgi:hypothetical protein
MKRYLVIVNEIVDNDIIAEDDFIPESNWIEQPILPLSLEKGESYPGMGWAYKDGAFIELPQTNSEPIVESTKDDLLAQLQALQYQIAQLK